MKCNSDYYLGVFNETHDANGKDQEKKIVIYFSLTGYCVYIKLNILFHRIPHPIVLLCFLSFLLWNSLHYTPC